jgi:hypothetical protein
MAAEWSRNFCIGFVEALRMKYMRAVEKLRKGECMHTNMTVMDTDAHGSSHTMC